MGKRKRAAVRPPKKSPLAFGLVLDDDTDGGIEVERFASRDAVVRAGADNPGRWLGVRDVLTGAVEWIDREASAA